MSPLTVEVSFFVRFNASTISPSVRVGRGLALGKVDGTFSATNGSYSLLILLKKAANISATSLALCPGYICRGVHQGPAFFPSSP